VAAWVPVGTAILGSVLMSVRSIQGKQLVVKRSFDALNLTFGSLSLLGLILLGTLIYIKGGILGLSMHYLVIGTVSSILNTLGGVFVVKASSVGPLGPVNALFTSASSVLFILIQFLRFGQVPQALELAGMLIGILGAFIMTIPEQVEKVAKFLIC
jgi:drug/metabolite transporter (DMT)-like permease